MWRWFCFVFNQVIQNFEPCKSPISLFPFSFLAHDTVGCHFVQFLAKALLLPVATSKIHRNDISGTTQVAQASGNKQVSKARSMIVA